MRTFPGDALLPDSAPHGKLQAEQRQRLQEDESIVDPGERPDSPRLQKLSKQHGDRCKGDGACPSGCAVVHMTDTELKVSADLRVHGVQCNLRADEQAGQDGYRRALPGHHLQIFRRQP